MSKVKRRPELRRRARENDDRESFPSNDRDAEDPETEEHEQPEDGDVGGES
jgi:hypothetical protein